MYSFFLLGMKKKSTLHFAKPGIKREGKTNILKQL